MELQGSLVRWVGPSCRPSRGRGREGMSQLRTKVFPAEGKTQATTWFVRQRRQKRTTSSWARWASPFLLWPHPEGTVNKRTPLIVPTLATASRVMDRMTRTLGVDKLSSRRAVLSTHATTSEKVFRVRLGHQIPSSRPFLLFLREMERSAARLSLQVSPMHCEEYAQDTREEVQG